MKTKLLALPVLFLAISVLQGCGDNKKEVTEDMLVGEWNCESESYQTGNFNENTGELAYENDQNPDGDYSKILFEKVNESPVLTFKTSVIFLKDKTKNFVIISKFNPRLESRTFLIDQEVYYLMNYEYVNKDEFKLIQKSYAIGYDSYELKTPSRGGGEIQTLKCIRVVK